MASGQTLGNDSGSEKGKPPPPQKKNKKQKTKPSQISNTYSNVLTAYLPGANKVLTGLNTFRRILDGLKDPLGLRKKKKGRGKAKGKGREEGEKGWEATGHSPHVVR
jgi:hypothetical protein